MPKLLRITALLLFIIPLLFAAEGANSGDKSGVRINARTQTSAAAKTNARGSASMGREASVVSVVDGDTVRVQMADGTEEALRLIGIDTPETKHPTKPVQCFGKKASQQAKQLLAGKSVTLEYDASQDTRDRYGRLLAYVILPDGTNFNKQMIADGYAYEYTYRVPYKYQQAFRQAQQSAREVGIGLWAEDTCGGERTPQVESETAGSLDDGGDEANPGDYECSFNVYNCSDFDAHSKVQEIYEACGGADNDVHQLDVDADGVGCESLK